MSQWIDPVPVQLPIDFIDAVGNQGLMAQLLIRRGYHTPEKAKGFLEPALYQPSSAMEMPGVKEALPFLLDVIRKKEPILVWGDFDVDGQTATTLLVSGIRQLGGRVRHYIPIRSIESHGVHPNRLLSLLKDETRLLVTCDTGTTAHQGIAAAKQAGLDVIITDHHELSGEIPPAEAVVTPRLLSPGHPLSHLPGVGVAYKLMEALFNEFNQSKDSQTYLDLVALGIVADVARLAADTRYLLQRGLKVLQSTSRLGLLALAEQAELNLEGLTSEHIAFSLAPRLNALGRLGDANTIVDFLTTSDRTFARLKAIELEALNARRKMLTDQVFAGALAQVEREPGLSEYPVLVLAHPSWPGGVIGIVANRLVEYFHKPVVLIATPPGEIGRGSARSIPGIHITEAIATQAYLLEDFGGHDMAAGIGIQTDKVDLFRKGLSEAVENQIAKNPTKDELHVDAWVNFSELSYEMVNSIYRLAPFGPGNPAPVLAARRQRILSQRNIGRYNEHLLLQIVGENDFAQNVFWWQGNGYPLPEGLFDLAYTVQPNTYQGQPGIQIDWLESRPILEEKPILAESTQRQWIDLRQIKDEKQVMEEINKLEDRVIWCEGPDCPSLESFTRINIKPSNALIIWTIPPGRAELQAVINKVKPDTIVFCAFDPGMDEKKVLLERLSGLTKFVIRKNDGKVILNQLAAATAQTVSTVQAGLEWLSNRGDISIIGSSNDKKVIHFGDKQMKSSLDASEMQFHHCLTESASFRNYFLHAETKTLIKLCTEQ